PQRPGQSAGHRGPSRPGRGTRREGRRTGSPVAGTRIRGPVVRAVPSGRAHAGGGLPARPRLGCAGPPPCRGLRRLRPRIPGLRGAGRDAGFVGGHRGPPGREGWDAMTRADDDSWDLASSVGATATMVAAGRAVASRDPNGLINDPFAAPLVRAVGIDFFTRIADGELTVADLDPQSAPRVQANIDEVAVRTRFFDDHFAAATARGIRQAVILAAGLDARAYRLRWP